MTIKDLLARAADERGSAVALRYKLNGVWETMTYHRLLARTQQVAEVLAGLGVETGDRVGIFLENIPEWPEAYFGIVGLGAIAAHCDAKLTEQEVAHILRDSGAKVLIAAAKSYGLIRQIEGHLPNLETVLLINGSDVLPVRSKRVDYMDYEDSLIAASGAAGSSDRAYDSAFPQEDAMASLIYTSGTTGRPKGAMLTHRNFTSNVEASQAAIHVRETDNFLLVLPLHHSFAFTANLLLPVSCGAEISFVESIRTLGENIREVQPSVLIAVPLLLDKIYAKILAGLKTKKLGYALYKVGLKKIVGKGVKKGLGGNLRMIITGGGPCGVDTLKGYMGLGLPILEGYGLTETAPVLTINPPEKPKPGTIGKPLNNVEIKIMEPNAEGVGEIAARGPNVMKGYFNAPEATAEVFQDDWFMTGDLGFINNEGYITITGRKKNVIVNREGKNIYPEEVEFAVCQSPFILEAVALGYREAGEKTGERVGVIVVPNQEALDEYAAEEEKRLTDQQVEELLRTEVKKGSQNIAEYKRPRRIQIRYEEFERTTTGKIKRYLYAMQTADMTDHG